MFSSRKMVPRAASVAASHSLAMSLIIHAIRSRSRAKRNPQRAIVSPMAMTESIIQSEFHWNK